MKTAKQEVAMEDGTPLRDGITSIEGLVPVTTPD
jgi:hypothetical protein